jgi:hypothetical protein
VLTTQHPLSAKLVVASATSGGRSVGILRSRTKAREFFCFITKYHQRLKLSYDKAVMNYILVRLCANMIQSRPGTRCLTQYSPTFMVFNHILLAQSSFGQPIRNLKKSFVA